MLTALVSLFTMYVLVLYQDEIWYVCPLKNVSTVRKKCMVKYSDNKKYAARVMAICGK